MASPNPSVFLLLVSQCNCDMVPPVMMPLWLTPGGSHSDQLMTWNTIPTPMAASNAMPLQNGTIESPQLCNASVPPSPPYLPLIHSMNESSTSPTNPFHHPIVNASECSSTTCNADTIGLQVSCNDTTPHHNCSMPHSSEYILKHHYHAATRPYDPGNSTKLIEEIQISQCMFALWQSAPPGIYLLVSDALHDEMVWLGMWRTHSWNG